LIGIAIVIIFSILLGFLAKVFPAKHLDRDAKINFIGLIILVSFFISIAYHYTASTYLNLGYPYNSFLFRPNDRFMDFLNLYDSTLGKPYLIARADYQHFPLLYCIAKVFTAVNKNVALFIFLTVFVIAFTCLCLKQLSANKKLENTRDAVIFTFFSYPVLFALDRGNFELWVFLLTALFLICYYKHPRISWMILSIMMGLKITCGIFMVLLLADRKYKEIVLSILTTVVLTLTSYTIMQGSIIQNISGHLQNLKLYTDIYVIHNEGLYFGHSLFGVLKLLIMSAAPGGLPQVLIGSLLKPYTFFVVIAAIVLVAYIVFFEKVFWKKVAILTISMCLFPYVSGDYKLLYFYLPMFFYINSKVRESMDGVYATLFALLLIPKDYYHLPFMPEVSSSIFLNPLLMLLMLFAILGSGLKELIRSTTRLMEKRIKNGEKG
jgi:hypothetical protein